MKNPFKTKGFDTIISKGMTVTGDLGLAKGTTTVVDGEICGGSISTQAGIAQPTCLVVNGSASMKHNIEVHNVTVTGNLVCDTLIVSGILAVKNGASVRANTIKYGSLVVEPKAWLYGLLVPYTGGPEKEIGGADRLAFDMPDLIPTQPV